jgi:transcriptional regulator with XRE-family HTH domain
MTAEEVLRLRIDRGLTQKEAAEIAGVHEVSWQRWEAGMVKRIRRKQLELLFADVPQSRRE